MKNLKQEEDEFVQAYLLCQPHDIVRKGLDPLRQVLAALSGDRPPLFLALPGSVSEQSLPRSDAESAFKRALTSVERNAKKNRQLKSLISRFAKED